MIIKLLALSLFFTLNCSLAREHIKDDTFDELIEISSYEDEFLYEGEEAISKFNLRDGSCLKSVQPISFEKNTTFKSMAVCSVRFEIQDEYNRVSKMTYSNIDIIEFNRRTKELFVKDSANQFKKMGGGAADFARGVGDTFEGDIFSGVFNMGFGLTKVIWYGVTGAGIGTWGSLRGAGGALVRVAPRDIANSVGQCGMAARILKARRCENYFEGILKLDKSERKTMKKYFKRKLMAQERNRIRPSARIKNSNPNHTDNLLLGAYRDEEGNIEWAQPDEEALKWKDISRTMEVYEDGGPNGEYYIILSEDRGKYRENGNTLVDYFFIDVDNYLCYWANGRINESNSGGFRRVDCNQAQNSDQIKFFFDQVK